MWTKEQTRCVTIGAGTGRFYQTFRFSRKLKEVGRFAARSTKWFCSFPFEFHLMGQERKSDSRFTAGGFSIYFFPLFSVCDPDLRESAAHCCAFWYCRAAAAAAILVIHIGFVTTRPQPSIASTRHMLYNRVTPLNLCTIYLWEKGHTAAKDQMDSKQHLLLKLQSLQKALCPG